MSEEPPQNPERGADFETLFVKRICTPVLGWIPESVHPNTLSLVNHVVAWTSALLAVLSASLPPLLRLLAMTGAGLALFAFTVGDCLDGMQARRTNRCSRLGEALDHWLDAVHVPLVTVGLAAALELEPWAVVLVHVTNAMIYHAQVAVMYQSGHFQAGESGGSAATSGTSAGYLVVAVLFFLLGRHSYWMDLLVTVLCSLAVVVQLRLSVPFYLRLGRRIWQHLPFVLLCAGLGCVYLLGAMGKLAFLLSVVLLSWRITGGCVLATILGERFSSFDGGIAVGILAMGALHLLSAPLLLAGISLQALLPYLACLYLAGRTLAEFGRRLPILRPAPEKAP